MKFEVDTVPNVVTRVVTKIICFGGLGFKVLFLGITTCTALLQVNDFRFSNHGQLNVWVIKFKIRHITRPSNWSKRGNVIGNLPKLTKFVMLFSLRRVELQHSSYKMMSPSNNVSILNICPGLFCTPFTMSCSSCFRRSLQSGVPHSESDIVCDVFPALRSRAVTKMGGSTYLSLEHRYRNRAQSHNSQITHWTKSQLISTESWHTYKN